MPTTKKDDDGSQPSRDVQKLEELLEEAKDLAQDISETATLGRGLSSESSIKQINLFKARISRLDSTYEKYSKFSYEARRFARCLKDDDVSQEIKLLNEETRNLYYEALAAELPQTAPSDNLNQTISSAPTTSSLTVKLPVINLPIFDGNIANWSSFKDTFISLIDDNKELSPVQKFHYLKTSLKGIALQSIATIPITAQSYVQAWSTLIKKFENKRIQAASYLAHIFNFKPLTRVNLKTLEEFSSRVIESGLSFKNLDIADGSGFILLTYALKLLDSRTREKFEVENMGSEDVPTFTDFVNFIHRQITMHQSEALNYTHLNPTENQFKGTNHVTRKVLISTELNYDKFKCPLLCKERHPIERCPRFLKLTPKQRYTKVIKEKLCTGCLKVGHFRDNCVANIRCNSCEANTHHSLLHFRRKKETSFHENSNTIKQLPGPSEGTVAESQAKPTQPVQTASSPGSEIHPGAVHLSNCMKGESYVLLGTAMGRVRDVYGHYQKVRILIDNGAQRSFITSSCARRLGLPQQKNPQFLSGFGNQPISGGRYQISCEFVPLENRSEKVKLTTVVTPIITGPLPVTPVPSVNELFQGLDLADRYFWTPKEVDVLIGADGFGQIFSGEVKKPFNDGPYALLTIFGWVILGPTDDTSYNAHQTNALAVFVPSIEDQLRKFWEIEEVGDFIGKDPIEEECEKHFIETHSRTEEGRYIVRLPFRSNDTKFGDSRSVALRRFYNLELKLNKNHCLKEEYNQVVNNYLNLGYISKTNTEGSYYLPHHGVVKESSMTTRLRIVFDASARTSRGSLNDQLHTGPKLQQDIRVVILNFRKFPIAMTVDMRQMYLQILVHSEDRKFQHFFYRFDTSESVKEYEFNRLTFGMSASPYLAQRVIRQLVVDEGGSYPRASSALLNSTYMDDVLTGAFSVEEAKAVQRELIELLLKGGFQLNKWTSNSTDLLQLTDENTSYSPLDFASMEDRTLKILGLRWDPKSDEFFYVIQIPEIVHTKRAVLSAIARIFDPLGYLAPVIFQAKVFLQSLWNHKLDWDDLLPSGPSNFWESFLTQLPALENVRIARCLSSSEPSEHSLVGFADASSHGYAAVLYLKSYYSNGNSTVRLLAAKTKLAPIKTISIPRLELCAALLLVRLVTTLRLFKDSLNITSRYYFSDSTIVLSWIRLPPNTLKVFVANRVSEIISNTSISDWHHVYSEDNPADISSRGVAPTALKENVLWWNGPAWLENTPNTWPIPKDLPGVEVLPDCLPQKTVFLATLSKENDRQIIEAFTQRFSSLESLQRVLAYMQRFVANAKKVPEDRSLGMISVKELKEALLTCIRCIQRSHFTEEMALIAKNSGHKTRLKSLSPFIDDRGLLRVGGRLAHSPLTYQEKHPIVLPSKSDLTYKIIDYLHQGYLHAGPKLLFSLLQRRYWVLSGRRVVKQRIYACDVCLRHRHKTLTPYMADLPQSRFEQGRAFLNTGVDYAGPFIYRQAKLRNGKLQKCYICIFVCLSTKAVHLELVSDLTTDAFLACLDRFIARRGLPSKLFSDHGSNFVGADKHLQSLYQWLNDNAVKSKITEHLTRQEVIWRYNPPTAAHFSGLWEAGVKSVKTHLRRVLGNQPFTFEEFATILSRIESILNSRPLYELTSSPEDYSVLTPGHFLIGDALVALPEYDLLDVPINRLSRWQLLRRCIQQIWSKWKLDYLNSLQQRMKWVDKNAYSNLSEGMLVLLKEPNASPSSWPTARVIETLPGKDGVVRVVKIRTKNGEYTRPVSKLVLLFPRKDVLSN